MGNTPSTPSLSGASSSPIALSSSGSQYHDYVPVGFIDTLPPSVAPPSNMKPRPHLVTVTVMAPSSSFASSSSSSSLHSSSSSTAATPRNVAAIKPSKLGNYFLDLSHLNLSNVLPGCLERCSNLHGLYLSFNKLASLPEQDVAHLSNLCFLDLSSNNLSSLPAAISSLSFLVELKASRNRLTELPTGFTTSLAKLEVLDLSHNNFSQLPQTMHHLSALTTLHLDGNPLSSIPFEVSKLKFLRNMTLEECPLLDDFPETLALLAPNNLENEAHPTPATPLASATATTLQQPVSQSKVPSLKELAARVLVRCSIPVTEEAAPKEVVSYLASAHTCSFCSGPFFEYHVKRYRFVIRGGVTVPMESRLCNTHWSSDKDRILALFRPTPATGPITLSPERLQLISMRNSRQAASRMSSVSSISTSSLSLDTITTKKGKVSFKRSRKTPTSSASQGTALSSSPSNGSGFGKRRKASGAEAVGSAGLSPSGSNSNFTRMEFLDEQSRTLRGSPSTAFSRTLPTSIE